MERTGLLKDVAEINCLTIKPQINIENYKGEDCLKMKKKIIVIRPGDILIVRE